MNEKKSIQFMYCAVGLKYDDELAKKNCSCLVIYDSWHFVLKVFKRNQNFKEKKNSKVAVIF